MNDNLYTHGKSIPVGSLLERHAPIKSAACAKSSLSKEVVGVTVSDGTKCSDYGSITSREASDTLVSSFQTVDSEETLVSSRQRKLARSCLGEFKPYVPAYICEPGAYQYPATDLNRLLEQFQGAICEDVLAGRDPYAKTTTKLKHWRDRLEDPDDCAAVDRLLKSKLSLITLQRNLEGKFIDELTFFSNPDNFNVFVNEIDNFFVRPSSTASSPLPGSSSPHASPLAMEEAQSTNCGNSGNASVGNNSRGRIGFLLQNLSARLTRSGKATIRN
ncbi:hypothetical protein TRVA0_022S00562 [Trichomonascus vanleenenianus]|uniref:uncharacterized protein n=1 Tax=Trichomonascus vanleenenianus TaxID=2268995 RepID=UPI003ECAC66A